MSLRTILSTCALKLGQTYDAHRRAILAAAATLVVAVLALTVALWTMIASLPTGDQLRTVGDMSQATTLYDVADRPVFTIFKEYRVQLPLSHISPTLRQAILAIEDQRFFNHGGIDYLRIGAAAIVNMRQGRAAQGGSTITQQLARQTFLAADKTIGGFARPTGNSVPHGTSRIGLVRYQRKNVSGRTVRRRFHRSGAVDVASMNRA